MKKVAALLGVVFVLVLAVTPVAFASNGNGPAGYDTCPKESMDQTDLASFEEIIEEFKAAMTKLRGNKDTFEERMQLKEEKRDDLLEIVPDGFEERFGGLNKNQSMKNQKRNNKTE